MEKEDQRNFILALVLMVGFLWVYQTFIIGPQVEEQRAAEAERLEQVANAPEEPETVAVEKAESAEAALASKERKSIAFEGEGVKGSINLVGARIDDLLLKREMTRVDSDEPIRLFRPENGPNGYYAAYGWLASDGYIANHTTEWTPVTRNNLTSGGSIKLTTTRSGITIDREIALDENYMFTVTDTVTNGSSRERQLNSWGTVRRYGDSKEFLVATDPEALPQGEMLAHQGLIGVLNDKLTLRKYAGLKKGKTIKGSNDAGELTSDKGGWIGFTDKYWMGALIPQQDLTFTTSAKYEPLESGDEQKITIRGAGIKLAPGESRTVTNHIFAGAKRLEALRAYENELGIPRFDDAIDWGSFYFLTKPFYGIIIWLKGILGSFGLAILGFTVLVKLVLFPLYNASYRSMAKMKKLSEPMKEIRERFAADRQRQQQEIMKLYKETGANPVAGCLPILATIPIFFALYKTLYVTIEMRHESFLWLKDLAAPDPTALLNGFGLFGFLVSAESIKSIPLLGIFIGIGALPVLYGLTMWAMQSLNPPPDDPMQRRIIAFLPLIFTFVFAGFAGGLVLYFVWNNILTILQQYTIMRRQGVETQFDKLLAKHFGKKEGA